MNLKDTENTFSKIETNAHFFAKHIAENRAAIHSILRKYQSNEVIEDEIRRSIDALQNIHELQSYFKGEVKKMAVFLPLNLPLYSFVIFAAIPSYQSQNVVVKAPMIMTEIFTELSKALSVKSFYKNISFFVGQRQDFIESHCKVSDVVIFTGKYENFVKIRDACGKNILILYNGVGHNPVVVTETADINLAAEKVAYVKLFNNGQDCAGPDMVLVHSNVADKFLEVLLEKVKKIKVDCNYADPNTKVGPLFEATSINHFGKILNNIIETGGKVVHGGMVDYKNNLIYPCICLHSLRQYTNFEELYCPIIILDLYTNDDELDLYFNDPKSRFVQNQMYVSVFGYSKYVARKLPGVIPLVNISIHDAERGTEEYGGYGAGASSVSYGGLTIPKPLLISREIYTYLFSPYKQIFGGLLKKEDSEEVIIEKLFKENVSRIFGKNLVFAYIFGSFARGRAKSYSDIDTFICVNNKNSIQIKKYLEWIFNLSEVFGKIPDFKYPAEIVEYKQLSKAVNGFNDLKLTTESNTTSDYDSMVWLHSLSHNKMGVINQENIPLGWDRVFPSESGRIMKQFLDDLQTKLIEGKILQNHEFFSNIYSKNVDIISYINNLGNGKKLIDILKYITFDEKIPYAKEVERIVEERPFFGRNIFLNRNTDSVFNEMFRFGVIEHQSENIPFYNE